jgi:ornithine cyclodeaminase/alanine dehydrogenase-like protein (mu-crystallin family)
MLTFSSADIKKCVSMPQAIQAMRESFISLTEKNATVPQRIRIDFQQPEDSALFMPVYLPGLKQFGIKTVSIINNNPQNGLPLVHALFNLFDAQNGKPLAVMDAEYITALRTGAASGLATDLMARKDSKVLAIFGTGPQAETQVEAILAVRDINRILVFARDESRTLEFSKRIESKFSVITHPAESQFDLMKADIICTATTSRTPVFDHLNLKPGVHINGIGSFKPDMAEIPSETICKSKVIADSISACLAEAGDLIQPINSGTFKEHSIHGEIGEIAAGKKKGRTNPHEITVFKSVGNAVQDLAIANIVFQQLSK